LYAESTKSLRFPNDRTPISSNPIVSRILTSRGIMRGQGIVEKGLCLGATERIPIVLGAIALLYVQQGANPIISISAGFQKNPDVMFDASSSSSAGASSIFFRTRTWHPIDGSLPDFKNYMSPWFGRRLHYFHDQYLIRWPISPMPPEGDGKKRHPPIRVQRYWAGRDYWNIQARAARKRILASIQ